MSLTTLERYSIYPAIFDGLTVANIRNVTPSSSIRRALLTAGGAVDPEVSALIAQDPTFRIASGDLGTVLAAVSLMNGMLISSTAEIQYQKRAPGGVFSTGSDHVSLNCLAGFLQVADISAQQDAEDGAEINLQFTAHKVGANPIVAVNTGQPLTGTPAIGAMYKLAATVYEGSILGGVQSAKVSPGIRYETKRGSGETAPTTGSILARGPTIEIDALNLSLAGAVGFELAAMSAGLTQYFEKVGTPPATSGHISISFAAGDYEISEVPVAGDGDANTRLVATLTGGSPTINLATVLP